MAGNEKTGESTQSSSRPDKDPRTTSYDPEHEIPDPDQVERDIAEAEKTYRKDEDSDKSAA